MRQLDVELVEHSPGRKHTGIGRYTRELYQYLANCSDRLSIRITNTVPPPFATKLTPLRHFPVGVRGHRRGAIAHFTQIMGCSQMLWHPVHPAIATVHDLGFLVCPEDEIIHNAVDRWVIRCQLSGLRKMDHFAVNSDATRRDLTELLGIPSDRIHHVQLGVDSKHFRPIPDARRQRLERYGVRPLNEGFDLLYVGSELPRKNVGLLLTAIAVLKARGFTLRLIKVGAAGGTRWRAATDDVIQRLKLSDDVVIIDSVPEDDLPVFYSAADLCVTPTLLEGGFAWLAMEGMACGRPVVATTAALVPPDAQDAVIVVPTRDLEAMVAAITRCLQDERLRLHLAQTGREIVRRPHYAWKATASAMISVYRLAATGGDP